jgi:multiple sugar transport system substrate-binding protein
MAFSRRRFFTGVAATAAAWGAARGLAPALQRAAATAARTVALTVWATPETAGALGDLAPRFTEQNPTITVTVAPMVWEALSPQILADVAARAGAYDLATWDAQAAGAVAQSFLDLDAFRKAHLDLVDPNYDVSDFDPGVWRAGGVWAGKNIGIPFHNNTLLFYYRKDLFSDHALRASFYAKYNRPLGAPKTWGEAADVAAFFTQWATPSSPTPYGIGLMFPRAPTLFSMYVLFWADYRRSAAGLAEWGKVDPDYGDYFTGARTPAFANTFGVRALQDMKTLMPYSPAPLRSDSAEVLDHFSKGTVAMALHWASVWPAFQQSQVLQPVDEKVGVALMPGTHSVGGIWALGINRVTRHPVEAFKFLQWATNGQNDKERFLKFGLAPARISSIMDPEVRKTDPRASALLDTYPAQGYRPRISAAPRLEDATVGTFSEILGRQRTNDTAALQALAAEWGKIVSG